MQPSITAAIQCLSLEPLETKIALDGPVKQLVTQPKNMVTNDAAPQAAVIELTGGTCPTDRKITIPCAFCAATTVIASGKTNSKVAASENSGTMIRGVANIGPL